MKRRKFLLIIVLLLILLNVSLDNKVFAENTEKVILIINSHTEDYAWTSDVLKGIFKTINPSEINANIHMENFDYKYLRKENIEEDLYELIKTKYANKKLDLVITTDLKASEFAIKNQKSLLKNTPIVFSGISRSKAREITKDLNNICGIVERPNIEKTLRTAFNVTPDAKTVYVIHDNTGKGKDSFEEIKKAALKLDRKLVVKRLDNIERIKTEFTPPEINKESIIIGTIFLQDDDGRPVSMPEVAEKVSREMNLPIFYLQESAIGHGVVGGSMLNPELHGMNAANIALRVLKGESPSSIGLVEENNSKDIFDYNALKRFKISESALPRYSKIINKPYNLKEEQRKIFLVSAMVIAVLLWFIIYLSFNIRKRKQVEADMILVNQDLITMKEELEQIAYYDEITGLSNRAMFYKEMTEKLDLNPNCENLGSVIYLDIDDFKDINDTFGHAFGDLVLVEVSKRLKSIKNMKNKKNKIYRISGDEYILDLHEGDETQASQVAEEIKTLLSKSLNIKNKELKISGSIGIVFYPRDGCMVEEIFKKAELSMYKAKESGKNCFIVYEEEMEQEIAERMFLEKNLREALDKNEFLLNYQPQVDPYTNQVIGFESLLRWHSEAYGLVSPMKFIPVAEQTGEIKRIGKWVLEESCRFAIRINEYLGRKIKVSVNISSIQLFQDDFIDMVKDVIAETKIDPSIIGIEVTETALMECFDQNVKKLEKLKDMGFKVYLDDFGTGYSSLNYLLRLPINTIKIDKSFIDDMMVSEKGRKITERIIKLAHDMELDVVAEGVELEEQLFILKKLKCNIIQGYIFGKPLSEKEAFQFISENKSL